MTLIPGLPAHLAEPPPAPRSPDDPEAETRRAAYQAWALAVLEWRVRRRPEIERDPVLQALEIEKCRLSPAYWLLMWGFVYEPRDASRGDEKPFILFPVQVDLLEFYLRVLESEGADADGAVSKSRDMGASWILCAFALWGWLFRSPWKVTLVSRNEDLVDSKSSDSLFWKIDFLLDRLPRWMLPAKYTKESCRFKLMLAHPTSSNQIDGESTTSNAARGGRATWVGFDEAAFIPDFFAAWSGAANSTDHRFAVSSESIDVGTDFYDLQSGKKSNGVTPAPFVMEWWENLNHTIGWYEQMRERFAVTPDRFEREVNRNPLAGNTTIVYPKALDLHGGSEFRWRPNGGKLYVGIDPGLDDDTAMIWAQADPGSDLLFIVNGYSNRAKPADFYGSIATGQLVSGEWDYDSYDLDLMDWTKLLPMATWYGDTYGKNVMGATLDSFYDRLRKGFHIYVNADRTPADRDTADLQQARSLLGRRQALMKLLPRLRFADTPGAMQVLDALQSHKFAPRKSRIAVQQKPLHDDTSHYVSALEYLAVHLQMRRQAAGRVLAGPRRSRQSPMADAGVRWGQVA